MSTRDDQFCEGCEVSMDLHDGPDSCDYAIQKANLMSHFWTSVVGGHRA